MREEIVNSGYIENIDPLELVAGPVYILLIFFYAYIRQKKNERKYPYYSYYFTGVTLKITGAIVFCVLYIYYYRGGDTFSYFESARSYSKLFVEDSSVFFDVYFGKNSLENYSLFNKYTGYPASNIFFESRGNFVAKFMTPIVFMGANGYLTSTILLSFFSFAGIWRMYELFCRYYPGMTKWMAYAFLFFPTAIFWGSGILKDTITLSAFCWFVVAFEKAFISKKRRLINFGIFLLTAYIILSVKPYIVMACVPGIIIWLFYSKIHAIKNKLVRYTVIPLIFALSGFLGFGVLSLLGDSLDKFALDKVIDNASVAQRDLKREAYKGNSFDIGEYDASVEGITSKIPEATIAGLYRPFLWDVRNIVMLLSAIENTILIFLTFYPFFKYGARTTFRIFVNEPLLLFILLYSIIFAFSIGVSTSNFGALIRFKIAFAPFFATMLVIVYSYFNDHLQPVRPTSRSAYS